MDKNCHQKSTPGDSLGTFESSEEELLSRSTLMDFHVIVPCIATKWPGEGAGNSSIVEHLPCRHEDMSLIPSTVLHTTCNIPPPYHHKRENLFKINEKEERRRLNTAHGGMFFGKEQA